MTNLSLFQDLDCEPTRQQAGTPQALFDMLHGSCRFTVDACAVEHNHKMDRYWSPIDDGLAQSWEGERVWCNPPYEDIGPWLAKGQTATLAAFLLPVRTDRQWWRRFKPLCECHYFVGEKPHTRVQFVAPPGFEYSNNPDCNCLLCFGDGFTPGAERWRSGRTGELLPDGLSAGTRR